MSRGKGIRVRSMRKAVVSAMGLVLSVALVCGIFSVFEPSSPEVDPTRDASSSSSTSVSIATESSTSSRMESGRVVRVVDGDTLVVDVGGEEEKVRLIGIDAPESVHPDATRNTEAGAEASGFLKSLVSPGQKVYLQRDVSDRDRYGRLLRYVWLDEPVNPDAAAEAQKGMLNALIVASGYAVAADYAPDTRYSVLFHSLERQLG